MLDQDQIQDIKALFPAEALSADTSRGFELTEYWYFPRLVAGEGQATKNDE